ncbi:IS481 family transposase [Archaeoglobus sp.]
MKELSEEEKEIIREAKMKYKLGARRLEKVIEQVYGIHIPHNHIHKFLLKEGLAKEEPKKKRRRKPHIRYEREHSMSAGHIDWFDKNGVKFCAIIDDASRKILAAGEFQHANTANSIALVDKLVEDYWDILPMKELISDNGSEFGAHRRNGKKEWDSRFKRHVESLGIKLITSRIKHPQTNGKIEKFFDCYNRYRDDFDRLDDFVYWYNNVRFHESLDTKHYLQTPEDAFWSRLPVEVRVGLAAKLFDEVLENER